MPDPALHLRWRLEVPAALQDSLDECLLAQGASAIYREADSPGSCCAYFPPESSPDRQALRAFGSVRLAAEDTFADEDWLAKSRQNFGPFEVGRRFFVLPEWEKTEAPEARIPIVVNPGLAFGTGGHETTRLCMTLLEDLAEAGRADAGRLQGPVLDVGTGTGILALCAHLLGFRDIVAFDIDPDCGPAMEELVSMNAAVLHGGKPFEGYIGDLADPRAEAHAPYNGIIANILLETIANLLPGLHGAAAPSAWLVASGLLAEREDEALLTLAAGGFLPKRILREGQWIAVLCERTP